MTSQQQPQQNQRTPIWTNSLGDFKIDGTPIASTETSSIYYGCLADPNNKNWQSVGSRLIAIKIVRLDTFAAVSEKLAAKALGSNRYYGLMRVHGNFELQGNLYNIIEFVNGGDLFLRGVQDKSINELMLKRWMRDVLHGLAALHGKGLIHRDIKPENMLLGVDQVKLGDFGSVDKESPEPREMVGSTYILAPEIVRKYLFDKGLLVHPSTDSKDHERFRTYGDKKSDIWALGISAVSIIMHGFLFASRPPEPAPLRELYAEFYSRDIPTIINKQSLSPDLKEWLQKALKINPEERFTVGEALEHPWIQGKGKEPAINPQDSQRSALPSQSSSAKSVPGNKTLVATSTVTGSQQPPSSLQIKRQPNVTTTTTPGKTVMGDKSTSGQVLKTPQLQKAGASTPDSLTPRQPPVKKTQTSQPDTPGQGIAKSTKTMTATKIKPGQSSGTSPNTISKTSSSPASKPKTTAAATSSSSAPSSQPKTSKLAERPRTDPQTPVGHASSTTAKKVVQTTKKGESSKENPPAAKKADKKKPKPPGK